MLYNLEIAGVIFPLSVEGITGEANYPWPLHIATFITRIIYVFAFFRLWQMFGFFAQKRYFSLEAIGHLRLFTGLFALFTLLRIAIELIFIAVYEPSSGTAAFDSTYIDDLAYPVLFFIIAHILNEARKHEEEIGHYF